MTRAPESIHDRLNRELWRDRLGGWRVWAVMVPVLVLWIWALVPQPRDITHRIGSATGVSMLNSEAGPRVRIGVDLGGTRVEAGARSRILGPEIGARVCVEHSVGRWTGAETFTLTDIRFCDGSIPTSTVD